MSCTPIITLDLFNQRKLLVVYLSKNVKCTSCESVLSYCGTTSSMLNHIKNKHPSSIDVTIAKILQFSWNKYSVLNVVLIINRHTYVYLGTSHVWDFYGWLDTYTRVILCVKGYITHFFGHLSSRILNMLGRSLYYAYIWWIKFNGTINICNIQRKKTLE
jgi:hypothetical protein